VVCTSYEYTVDLWRPSPLLGGSQGWTRLDAYELNAPGSPRRASTFRFAGTLPHYTTENLMADSLTGGPAWAQERRLVTAIHGPKSTALMLRKAVAAAHPVNPHIAQEGSRSTTSTVAWNLAEDPELCTGWESEARLDDT